MAPKATNMSTAVRQRKGKKVQVEDTPQMAIYRKLNYYPTGPWAARAGAEILKEIDPAARCIWEPACGEGHMAEPLKEYFPEVIASDIHDHGYGDVTDFLLLSDMMPCVDWVFTNPPFDRAEKFLAQGFKVARRGVALLCRIAFLEGANRYPALYLGSNSLTICAPFIDRCAIQLGSWDPDGDSATCYAWFFFRKFAAHRAPPAIIRPIPPGTERRLTRPNDARRFAKLAPAPLFDAHP